MANNKSSYTKLKEKLKKMQEYLDYEEDFIELYSGALFEICWLNEDQLKKAPEIAQMALIKGMNLHTEK